MDMLYLNQMPEPGEKAKLLLKEMVEAKFTQPREQGSEVVAGMAKS